MTDWLDITAAGASPDMGAAAEKIQQAFDALDEKPGDLALAEQAVAAIGTPGAADTLAGQAVRELLRRYNQEYIPETQTRQPMTAMDKAEQNGLERIRHEIMTKTGVFAGGHDFASGTIGVTLRENNIPFRWRGGRAIVMGDVDFNDKASLPDLSGVIVLGSYYMFNVPAKNLQGTPAYVGRNFFCASNGLETLEGVTQDIGGSFDCRDNGITSLRGGPQQVGSSYMVEGNRLESIEGAPKELANGTFNIKNNPRIRDFEGTPHSFLELRTDYGTWASWDEVPDALKVSAEKIERREQQLREAFRAQVKAVVGETGTLTRAVAAPKMARFTRR